MIPSFTRFPMRLLAAAGLLLALSACSSYRSTEVRVVSSQGGGIADAVIEVTNQSASNEGFMGRTRWVTDAAGRAVLDRRDADSRHWYVRAKGYRPLTVDASPDAIRLKQADGRLPPHPDAVPLVFVLEPDPANAASDPKQFESKVK